jgi:hypothetical protein
MFPISSWPLMNVSPPRSGPWTGSEVLEVEPARGGGSHVLHNVRCGKMTCHCAKPGGELHGPYWYLYIKMDGRTGSKYIGKNKP